MYSVFTDGDSTNHLSGTLTSVGVTFDVSTPYMNYNWTKVAPTFDGKTYFIFTTIKLILYTYIV